MCQFKIQSVKQTIIFTLHIFLLIPDLLSQIKPPIFFCKNEKVRSVRHSNYVSDILYGEEDVKVVLDGNYQVYNNAKRRSQNLIVEEAHVALAKEEAASRFALEMLQKNISVTSFVIEDSCTEATVETSLTPQFNENNLTEEERNIMTETPENPVNIPEGYKMQDRVEKDKLETTENKTDDKIKDCLQVLPNEIPPDFPIIYKTSDGTFVNVSSEMFKSLAQSGALHYQILHDDGQIGDFQQFVCNDFNNTQINPEEINQLNKNKQPMTLKQLVAETISGDYPSDINNLIIVPNSEQTNENPAQSTSEVGEIPFNNYIVEKDGNYQENELLGKNLSFGENSNGSLHENFNDSMSEKGILS